MNSEEQLASLNKLEKRFLSRRRCPWCDQSLHRAECGSVYTECDDKDRVSRRAKCLETYKSRERNK